MSNKNDKIILNDSVKYFKNNKAFTRIFLEMRKKWKKYGRAAGYVILDKATAQERQSLGGILGKNFLNEKVKFSMREFEEALAETKYHDVTLKELLENYFVEELVTNKELKYIQRQNKANLFQYICDELKKDYDKNNDAVNWICAAQKNRKYGYNLIISEYEKSEGNISKIVLDVCKAIYYLKMLNGRKVRLAVLGAEITSNPHYFDKGNVAGKLLIQALGYINNIAERQNAEDILELYYLSGIKPDDISSYSTLYGISLYTEQGIHMAYETFSAEKEMFVVTLSNLNRIVRAGCKSKIIFIVENQMVFSHMCEELIDIPVSMICTSGQMKTASLLIIDLLCEAGCKLYYSGDTDPEGILIADKILSRHPANIIPWRISADDYYASISDEIVDETRIKKLEKISDSRLLNVLNAIRKEKRAGYQELLIDLMVGDIRAILNN